MNDVAMLTDQPMADVRSTQDEKKDEKSAQQADAALTPAGNWKCTATGGPEPLEFQR